MHRGARQLFIYYRVQALQAEEAMAAVRSMIGALQACHVGLQAALLRRPTEESEVTLMETYALDASVSPGGVDTALQAEIEARAQAALGGLLASRRHVEVFDTCA
jgi:hypothetical protein